MQNSTSSEKPLKPHKLIHIMAPSHKAPYKPGLFNLGQTWPAVYHFQNSNRNILHYNGYKSTRQFSKVTPWRFLKIVLYSIIPCSGSDLSSPWLSPFSKCRPIRKSSWLALSKTYQLMPYHIHLELRTSWNRKYARK